MDSAWELLALAVAALGTAWLSAVAGLGGGLVLLVILTAFMDVRDAIPVHGAIQIVSNGTRAWALRGWIRWDVVARHSVLLIPGGLVGIAAVERLPRAWARGLIGVFALLATWRPGLITPRLSGRFPRRGFLFLGAVHGAINMPLGATGPLIAPFFRSALDDRRRVVGTFAAAQVLGHLAKIVLFGAAGFVFADHMGAVAVGAAGVFGGSILGTRTLQRVSEERFAQIFRWAVTAVAVPLVIGALI